MRGMDLTFRPGFAEVEMPDGQTVSAIVIHVVVD